MASINSHSIGAEKAREDLRIEPMFIDSTCNHALSSNVGQKSRISVVAEGTHQRTACCEHVSDATAALGNGISACLAPGCWPDRCGTDTGSRPASKCEKIIRNTPGIFCHRVQSGVFTTSGESSDAWLYKFCQELPKRRDSRMGTPCCLAASRASKSSHHDSKRSRSSPKANSISATLFQQHNSSQD